MQTKELFTASHSPESDQADVVRTWQGRYTALIAALRRLGSEVFVRRILETDRDIPPHHFVRTAEHVIIFPPQEAMTSEDNSHVIDASPDYGLELEEVIRAFDLTRVKGRLTVRYDDSDDRIWFRIEDELDESELPEAVLAAIAETGLPDPA